MTLKQEMRFRQLKAMDKTIRKCTNDEDYFFSWIKVGIPDGSTDADFRDYAKDEEEFTDFLNEFGRLIELMAEDPEEMSKEELVNFFIQSL